jgi:hypothetical protein
MLYGYFPAVITGFLFAAIPGKTSLSFRGAWALSCEGLQHCGNVSPTPRWPKSCNTKRNRPPLSTTLTRHPMDCVDRQAGAIIARANRASQEAIGSRKG